MGVLASKSEGQMTAKLHHSTVMHFYVKFGDKSGVGIIVDYSRDYTVVNGV